MPSVVIKDIGSAGVNVVTPPIELAIDELISAQNAEVNFDSASSLDQRAGMTKINASALNSGAAVLMGLDVRASLLIDSTPYLYAGRNIATTGVSWRRTTDGTSWASVTSPAGPMGNNRTEPATQERRFVKTASIGKYFYFLDDQIPTGIHQWDGTTDVILSTIPPAVSGTTLATPVVYPTDPFGWIAQPNGTPGATTYTYKVVATAGASNGAASAAFSLTNGNATLNGTNYVSIGASTVPVAGATSYDVYRTAGGATQGKIGTIPITAGTYTTGNGSGLGVNLIFTDGGLVADGSTAPSSASGATASNTISVFDMITDGTSLYMSVLDVGGAGPTIYGRLLQFYPNTALWSQIGLSFPTASGNGAAAALAFYGGALNYGTYTGSASANTSYILSTGSPLPAGGVTAAHATAASLSVASMAVFQGELFVGTQSLVAGTAALVLKRTPVDTWATTKTGPNTLVQNAFTSLYVYNGRLYAGYSSSGSSFIYSTPDGINWTTEVTNASQTVVGQMIQFGANLYVVCPAIYIESQILQRTPGGVWTTPDTSTQLTGNLGIVYP